MNFGRLDRIGKLYTVAYTSAVGAAVVKTPTLVRTIPLSSNPVSAKTLLTAAREAEQIETVWVTRWFPGLVIDMELVVEGRTYRIVRHDELGRREGYRIYGRAVE